MARKTVQSGFTAVELLITLFVAAAFLIAAYQLFSLVIKDGGETRAQSRASNIAYDYMRQYAASSTTIPCTATTPLNNASINVDGLSNTTITIRITCLPNAIDSLSKVEATISYNQPLKTVVYATYVSSSGNSGASDITDGLVAWWKLNGDANTAIGSPNATINNATSSTHDGIPNTAYAFNGTNSSITASSTYGLGTTSVTISAWIWSSTTSNSGSFVAVGDIGSGYGIGMGDTTQYNSAPGTKIVMDYAAVRWVATGTNVGSGWHHIVMTIDANGTPTGYVDGSPTGSYPGTNAKTPTGSTYIGAMGSGAAARFFTGNIDDVRLYNRALSLSEILSLYSAGAK